MVLENITIESIIAISDKHGVAITGIATVILMLATILLSYFNLKMWYAQDRPHLIFFPKSEGESLYLYIRNVGKGSAIKIKFKLDTKETKIPALPKDWEHRLWRREWPKPGQIVPNEPFPIITELSYEDINGHKYEEYEGKKSITIEEDWLMMSDHYLNS